jgi:hypothetical protein
MAGLSQINPAQQTQDKKNDEHPGSRSSFQPVRISFDAVRDTIARDKLHRLPLYERLLRESSHA